MKAIAASLAWVAVGLAIGGFWWMLCWPLAFVVKCLECLILWNDTGARWEKEKP